MLKRYILTLMAAGTCLTGCFDLPDFPPSSIVTKPRILAVIADPPEATPATGTRLSLMVAGATEVSQVRWTVCGIPSGQLGMGNQTGENDGDRTCSSQDENVLGEGERVSVPGLVIAGVLGNVGLQRASLGADLPDPLLAQIRQTVGFAATVDVELVADGVRLGALKRVLISEREQPGTNPPPPTFRFGDTIVNSLGDGPPYRCQSDGVLHAEKNQTITLTPLFDGDVEPWLEDYNVLDARGITGMRKEQAFYSWFASDGEIDHGTTKAPDRGNSWRAPNKNQCAQLWLVVRDGHGGQTACNAYVSVGTLSECAEQASE